MNAAFMLDRVKNPALLKNDKEGVWLEIISKFPYCTIAQWLKFGADKFSNNENLREAFLYKSEPIEFASFLRQLSKPDVQEDKIQPETTVEVPKSEITDEAEVVETEVPHTEIPESKEIIETDMNVEVSDKEEISPIVSDISDPVSLASKPTEPAMDETYAEILDEIREESPVEQQGVDILELINEIPNSTPFETAEIHKLSVKEHDLKEEEQHPEPVNVKVRPETEEESEEDKSLMVMMSFTDWLNHFKQKSSSEREEVREKKALKTAWQKEKLAEAADEEVDEIPEPIFKQAMDSISMESSLISESLAEILAMQGKKDKAIAMYKKLIVRNPEKSTYFNQKIQDLNAGDN